MLVILCDICGEEIEQFDIKEDFQIMKYKAQGRTCCEGCEEVWNAYEIEVQEAEARSKEDLEEAVAKIKGKYFNEQIRPTHPGGRKDEKEGEGPPKRGFSHFKLK